MASLPFPDDGGSDATAVNSSSGEDDERVTAGETCPGGDSAAEADEPVGRDQFIVPWHDPVPPLTPRMRAIYDTLRIDPHDRIRSVVDAAAMDGALFGKRTSSVRLCAIHELRSRAPLHPTMGAAPTRLPALVAHVPTTAAPPAGLEMARVGAAGTDDGAPTIIFVPVEEAEDARIARAVAALLAVIPESVLHSRQSHSVPDDVVRRNLEVKLRSYDSGTLHKGKSTWVAWAAFCDRHSLPRYGEPFDADMCLWFIREEDDLARARAAAHSSAAVTGASVRHARACSLRWLRSALGIPFQASDVAVRRFAPPDRSREPRWSEMWGLPVLRMWLYLVCRYEGQRQSFVLPYAASAYLMCLASLRQVDGVRSKPPWRLTIDGVDAFASVAIYTKAHRRESMRPLPWWVPAMSIDPAYSDAVVAAALERALRMLPQGAPSMFLSMVDDNGRSCNVTRAVAWGASCATDAVLCSSLTAMLTWQPIGLLPTTALHVAKRKHGPRHTMVEFARAMCMPVSARDELGRWEEQGGRMRRLSNRYSREAEATLQIRLRARVLQRVRCAVDELSLEIGAPLSLGCLLPPADSVRDEEVEAWRLLEARVNSTNPGTSQPDQPPAS